MTGSKLWGLGMRAGDEPLSEVKLGAPPYMDDLVIRLSDDSPCCLIVRMVEAANLLERVAMEF